MGIIGSSRLRMYLSPYLEKETVVRVRAKKVGWMAVGFCHRVEVERRRYSGLNSCG